MAFTAGLARIQGQIADLIKEASALELMYEGAQKKFAGILEQVEKEVKEYLDTQSMVDCTTFMDESFDSLRKVLRCLQCLAFHPGCSGHGHNSSLTADFSMGECVTLPLEDISFAAYVQHHSGVGADGIAQLCSLTKCHRMGEDRHS